MPRPMPIVVPGTGGMGSTSTNVGMNLQLDKIIPFIEAWNEKYVTEPARRESLFETLGMSPEEGEGLATEQMQKMAADNAQIRSAVETLKGITKKEERSRVAPTLTKPGVRDIAERWMREAGQPTTEQVDVPAIPGQTIDLFKSLLQADVTPTADILSRIGLIPGKEGKAGDIVTWITPEGETVNLVKGTMPPEGSTEAPSRSIRESVGDVIDDAMPDLIEAWHEENPGKTITAVIKRDLRQQAANTLKREGVLQVGSKAGIKAAIKVLPDLRDRAYKASNTKKRISKMQGLLDEGVTGKPGQFKKALAGWLEFFPEFAKEKIENYSDAQLFALLGRMMTGPMRLDIVGPGPVSEAEQKLWDTMSAGGGAAEPAARELLQMYSDISDETVAYYNESRDAASRGNPSISLQFQRIGRGSKMTDKSGKTKTPEQAAGDVITTKSGRKARLNAQGQYEYID